MKNQLSFNKMIETQLAQIAASISINNDGKISRQPETSLENVNAVTTRGGKSTHDPPNPNHASRKEKEQQEEEPSSSTKAQKDQEEVMVPLEYMETMYLLFPTRKRKQAMDEQFAHFIEMVEKVHMSIPLMDVFHVPCYAKYIKDIINNKRPLPSTEVVKLTEVCRYSIVCLKRRRILGVLCNTLKFWNDLK
jgi:hypothetical protein